MNKILTFLLLLVLPSAVLSQNINGRFSSAVYSFERFINPNSSQTYIRSFQTLSLNVNKSKYSLKTRLNLEADLANSLVNDPRLRFYNLYFEGRKLYDLVSFKIGRQPIFNGIGSGVMDGASLKVKYMDYSISGYFGGRAPSYQKLEVIENLSENYIAGGKITAAPIDGLSMKLSYVDKRFHRESYTAQRLDQDFILRPYKVNHKSNQFNFVSASASYKSKYDFDVYTKFDYDLNFDVPSKFEISGDYEATEKIGINLYYNFREPRIRYNSIFSVFNYGNTQEIEAGFDYKYDKNFTVIGKFGNVLYEDDTSQRITIGVNSGYGSINYRKTFGFAGELDAVSLFTAKSFMDGFVTPSIGLSYSNFKLSENSKSNGVMSILTGVNLRPWRKFSFDLQAQYFSNEIYKNDLRLFFKVNHWFNTNLDIL